MARILLVDDEPSILSVLCTVLRSEDYDVVSAADGQQAIELLKNETFDLLISDIRMAPVNGMDILKVVHQEHPDIAVIMLTAYGSVETAIEALKLGAFDYVTKPFKVDELLITVQRALSYRNAINENATLKEQLQTRYQFDNIIAESPLMKNVCDMIRRVAPTDTTVLIYGQSGTGKELIAKAIHAHSTRSKKNFLPVNCAALPEPLLESEMFGHVKGSFTGATGKHMGKFQEADGGTLFLDEIGEIDATTQVKLLRALSERTIERVGSNASVKVDVRVLAATNKNLATLVESGDFREDLYFRLNVVRVEMPPLRTRAEDIVLLAGGFLREFAEENGRPIKPLTDDALALLRRHPWPGNVRELRTAIEHGVVMSNDSAIDVRHLPESLRGGSPSPQPATSGKIALAGPPEFNLHALETQAIRTALSEAGGNRTHAAELLGISRRTLQRKLKDLGV